MHIQPIFAALRRNRAGAILIGLQIALTLGIVCNALFIIAQRLDYIGRPTGIDEQNLIALGNLWVGHVDADAKSLAPADLATIRGTPGVVDAYRTNSYPLRGGGWSTSLTNNPESKHDGAHTAVYFSDDHSIQTLGVHLVAGRNFTADEIADYAQNDPLKPAVAIVSQSLANTLYPDGSALGKPAYSNNGTVTSTIIGIVDRLQTPWVGFAWGDKFFLNTMLVPGRENMTYGHFVIRTAPGRRDEVLKSVQERLYAADRMRVVLYARTFDEIRHRAYKKDRGMAALMAVVCTALLAVTAAGIVGLTSFWVAQRQRQIGIRRALGATRSDILRYFHTENLLIGGGGVLIGATLAVGLNVWLVTHYEMARLSPMFVLIGSVIVLGLGQAAVFQPALRASRVPPVTATRAA